MTFDDLKNLDLASLDLKNIGGWPLPAKVAGIVIVCLGILFGGYWFLIKGEIAQYDQLVQQEAQLKSVYTTKKVIAINLPLYRAQLAKMRVAFGAMLQQLPNRREVPDLLVNITEAGLGRGLQFVLFKPGRERPIDFYAELPIAIEVRGTYHEFGEFVSDLAALPRIVTIGDIRITGPDPTGELTMLALAKTYRYVVHKAPPRRAVRR